jgi:hypothetical protein
VQAAERERRDAKQSANVYRVRIVAEIFLKEWGDVFQWMSGNAVRAPAHVVA